MPRRDHCYSGNSRLYVGHLSSRTRSRDLEHIFSRYGRICGMHLMQDYAFIEYRNYQDADDARHHLDGSDVDGCRITVEFAKVPRRAGGVRESAGRGPTPGSGRCFNCGRDGHSARDCTDRDWKNECYRCGKRGHIVKYCETSLKKLRRERSYSRSSMRSSSPRRGRSPSQSFRESPRRERSNSRSPMRSRSRRRGRSRSRSFSRSPSYRRSKSAHKRGGDVVYDERRSLSPIGVSSEPKRRAPPSKSAKHSSTPVRDSARERRRRTPRKGEDETGQDGYSINPQEGPSSRRGRREREKNGYSDSPKETSGVPLSAATTRYEAANGNNPGPSPIPDDEWSPIRNDGNYAIC